MNEPVLALDLGGTDLKAALCDPAGRVLAFARRPSRVQESAAAPYEAMVAACAELAGGRALAAIGLGCPGAIDPATGVLVDRTAHLPHWFDEPVRERLERHFGVPVAVDNDANCAALAEHELGAARGARVSVTLTIGTGVGMGIVVGGRVHQGARGGAGELGHIPLGRDERTCECGIESCVEPEISGSGLVEAARHAGLDARDAEAVFALAAQGEPRAAALIARLADRLGAAIATAVHLLDPDVVVIGGGVARAGDALLDPVRAAVARYAMPSHRRGLAIVPAALGDRAGVSGAGLIGARRAAAGAAKGEATWRT
jgi:glucokinase